MPLDDYMKKIDKLIIQAFIGPFILTFLVVVFILLTVQMMNYVDQIFGKDLSYIDLGILIFHFSVFQTPIAFPLSVMLASLMTFGNLGEHFELTAIKSAGISLTRALMPIAVIVMAITVVAFFSNNYFVPRSALKAYSLLYDIKQKKPALDIQPGQFYSGIENYKIKVDNKLDDGRSLQGLTIYNHTGHQGNLEVIFADSGVMYTVYNDRYLKFELYNGEHYLEGDVAKDSRGRNSHRIIKPLTRTRFERSEMLFDLSSFGMSRTDEGLFASNRLMRNFSQLNEDLDSLQINIYESESEIYTIPERYISYSSLKQNTETPPLVALAKARRDSIKALTVKLQPENTISKTITVQLPPISRINLKATKLFEAGTGDRKILKGGIREQILLQDSNFVAMQKIPVTKDSMEQKRAALSPEERLVLLEKIELKNGLKTHQNRIMKTALATTRQVKSKLIAQNNRLAQLQTDYYVFNIQWHKMLSHAMACISMFLIGAPLGAIIKRGGLGFPVLVSVLFFIIYYVVSIGGEKYAKGGTVSVILGVWTANLLLLPIGLFFLRQAKNDARLFDADFYKVMGNRLQEWFHKISKAFRPQSS